MVSGLKEARHGRILSTLVSLCVFLWMSLVSCRECLSWYTLMHKDIARAACENLPTELKNVLFSYKESILWNSMLPDLELQDWSHHEWNVHREPEDNTDGPEYVRLLAEGLILCLRNESCAMEKVAVGLGRLSHYIADLNQPLHTDDYLNDNDWIHLRYEIDLYQNDQFLQFSNKGFSFWDDIKAKAMDSVARANRYYAPIVLEYQNGGGLANLKKISQICFTSAVQDIINLWSTIWFAAKAKTPVMLAIEASQSLYTSGDSIILTISSIVTQPCLMGDLYVTITDEEGGVWYLTTNGEEIREPTAFKRAWRPRSRTAPLTLFLPVKPRLAGKSFTVSAFVTFPNRGPWSFGTQLSNIAKVSLEASSSNSFQLGDISAEPCLFVTRSFATGKTSDIVLEPWDFIFLGEILDNPATDVDESLFNKLIPGEFRHVMLYLGRDKLGRPVVLEIPGFKGLTISKLPELEERYFDCHFDFPMDVKDVLAYQNREAKRLNPRDKRRLEMAQMAIFNQIEKDLQEGTPYQLEFSWSGNILDKNVYLVDDGRDNGFSCTDYLLTLLEDNASVCIYGSRMSANDIEYYFRNNPEVLSTVIPKDLTTFPFSISVADIVEMGFHLNDPPPHVFSCDNSTETGLPVPSKLIQSNQFEDIPPVSSNTY